MFRRRPFLALAALLLATPLIADTSAGDAHAAGPPGTLTEVVTLELFDQELSPHGTWVVLEPFGRVWRPAPRIVGTTFVPYATGGHWELTEDGWEFDSDWDWGWATFHYGRWYRDLRYGWVWVPGTAWAPAWVEWRVNETYIGWVPAPPPRAHVIASHWTFVEARFFTRPRVLTYAFAPRYVVWLHAHTAPHRVVVVRRGTTCFAGPSTTFVGRARGVVVRPVPRRPAVPTRVRLRVRARA